tara:strand:+ start:1046 stop:3376 length:2331 start_codon:yes stop_codon:yes gene_type:complete
MKKKLVIVESPAKCKKIENYLGNDNYSCIATYGHFRQLKTLKDIDDNYNIHFDLQEEKSKYINSLKTAIRKSSETIIATDDDREGEGIAWHICDLFNLDIKTTKRIVFQEITKPAIKKAIDNPRYINMSIVDAQHTRQIVDMALGFKISPLLWDSISRKNKNGLSAGRCQTPALRIVWENNKIVNDNPGTFSYNTVGYFTSKNIPFELSKNHKTKEEMEQFLEESAIDYKMFCSDVTETKRTPPKPLITSTLQQLSSSNLHFSPKETMSLCQKLYENGFITYMRTDSAILSNEFLDSAFDYIDNTYGKGKSNRELNFSTSIKSNKDTTKDNLAQEAHEGIRPTDPNLTSLPSSLGNKEKRLYSFIHSHTIKCCMFPALFNKIILTIPTIQDTQYKYTSLAVKNPGYLLVDNIQDDPYYSYFQNYNNGNDNGIDNGNDVIYNKIISKCSLKNTKSYINEAKLVQELEDKGIGRPSTFSSIVDKIQERGYVKKKNIEGRKVNVVNFELDGEELIEKEEQGIFGSEKNKLIIQPVGQMVIEFLEEHFNDILNYDYTKMMENKLDHIKEKLMVKNEVCNDYYNDINMSVQKYKNGKHGKLSYKFDDNHEFIIGNYGPVIKYKSDDDTIIWKKVKEGITLDDIRKNNIQLQDVLDNENNTSRELGTFRDQNIILYKGRYGLYIQYNDKKISIKSIDKSYEKVTLADVIDIVSGEKQGDLDMNILRKINNDITIRKSKYGAYIFYKTKQMKKPKFIKLAHLKDTYLSCHINEIINLVKNSLN